MNSYLSQIASRSNENNSSINPPVNLDDAFHKSGDIILTDPVQQNEMSHPGNVPSNNLQIKSNVQNESKKYFEKTTTEKPEKLEKFKNRFVTSYITKHIHRSEFIENQEQQESISTGFSVKPNSNSIQSQSDENNEEFSDLDLIPINTKSNRVKNSLKNIEPVSEANKKSKESNDTSIKQTSEKTNKERNELDNLEIHHTVQKNPNLKDKEIINPPVNIEKLRKTKKAEVNISKIIPSRQHSGQNIPKTIKSKTAPKLIIGKITVEILAPEKPTQIKVVNRVIEKTSVTDNTKINKLIFGLGQL